MVGVVVALVAATIGLLARASPPKHGDHVEVRSSAAPELHASSAASSSTDLASTSSVSPSTVSPPIDASPPADAPATATPSPWQVSATTGLTNLASVTITGTGVPQDGCLMGECVAGRPVALATCSWNGDPQFAYPVDGVITGTVHVYWWVGDEHFDCSSAPGVCVVGVESMKPKSSFVPVSFPISFDTARRPAITVTPADSLVDGQSVRVLGTNIGEGSVQIEQCSLLSWASCTEVDAPSRPDGTFSTQMTVRRVLTWGGHGPGSATCGVDSDCVVEVWFTPRWSSNTQMWINRSRPAALHFAPVPATSSSSTTSASSTSSTTTAP